MDTQQIEKTNDSPNSKNQMAQIDPDSIISKRNVATSRLARLLGVENIIPN